MLITIHFPSRRAADILSGLRSKMISRSNRANDKRMSNVKRPSEDQPGGGPRPVP